MNTVGSAGGEMVKETGPCEIDGTWKLKESK